MMSRHALRLRIRAWLAIMALLVTTALSHHAFAHAIGLSSGEYSAQGSSVTAKLSFARAEAFALAPAIDADRDGHVTPAELASSKTLLESKIVGRLVVRAGEEICSGTLTDVALTEQDGLFLQARWDCTKPSNAFAIDFALLEDLSREHTHVARTIAGGATHDEAMTRDHPKLEIPRGTTPSAGAPAEGAPSAPSRPHGIGAFFTMGVGHILTGFDHLVFLVGVVLVRARIRALVAVVTAFTVAHSITLGVATLTTWTPSARVIEPAIALSIVYVGIENIFIQDGEKRWRVTFPFGLVHGFGFAGALREVALARNEIPAALLSFNLGVEAGQLAFMALLLPVLLGARRLLRDRAPAEKLLVGLASAAVALVGGIWFVARVVSG